MICQICNKEKPFNETNKVYGLQIEFIYGTIDFAISPHKIKLCEDCIHEISDKIRFSLCGDGKEYLKPHGI